MREEVQRFIDAGSDEQKALFAILQSLIMGLYPDADVVIYYGLPTYKTKSGQVSLGFWKGGVSLYTTGPQYIAAFKAAQPKIKTNKASINFKPADELSEADVKQVVEQALGHRE